MKEFYFIEVNAICVLILALIMRKTFSIKKTSISEKIIKVSIIASSIMCVSDAFLGLIDGVVFKNSVLLNQIGNIIYFVSGSTSCMCWCMYVCTKVGIRLTKKFIALMHIPYVISLLIILTNPFTDFAYYFTEGNEYVRGSLINIYWAVIIFYLFHATILSVKAALKEHNKVIRGNYLSYAFFIIFPAAGFTIQLIIKGITTTTVGISLGYFFYYIKSLENQISEDSLTGLNNRRQLEKFAGELIFRNPEAEIFVMMMDLNGFKDINDTYGHITGDLALKDFADSLRLACNQLNGNYMLCRYGGDEFSIVGMLHPRANLNEFIMIIRKQVAQITVERKREYSLSTSIGIASGCCRKTEDLNHLTKEADKRMYEDKIIQKGTR